MPLLSRHLTKTRRRERLCIRDIRFAVQASFDCLHRRSAAPLRKGFRGQAVRGVHLAGEREGCLVAAPLRIGGGSLALESHGETPLQVGNVVARCQKLNNDRKTAEVSGANKWTDKELMGKEDSFDRDKPGWQEGQGLCPWTPLRAIALRTQLLRKKSGDRVGSHAPNFRYA